MYAAPCVYGRLNIIFIVVTIIRDVANVPQLALFCAKSIDKPTGRRAHKQKREIKCNSECAIPNNGLQSIQHQRSKSVRCRCAVRTHSLTVLEATLNAALCTQCTRFPTFFFLPVPYQPFSGTASASYDALDVCSHGCPVYNILAFCCRSTGKKGGLSRKFRPSAIVL